MWLLLVIIIIQEKPKIKYLFRIYHCYLLIVMIESIMEKNLDYTVNCLIVLNRVYQQWCNDVNRRDDIK
jgi:hypothetical protein